MRYVLLILLLKVFPLACIAQVKWGKQFYNQSAEYEGAVVGDLVADGDGDVYILYSLYGSVDIEGVTYQSYGHSDILVVKRNTNGDLQWVVQMGGAGYDYGGDIDIGPSGDIHLNAYTQGGNFLGQSVPKGGVLIRMSSSSVPLWVYPVQNLNAGPMVVDSQGSTFIATSVESEIEIRKYDVDGTLLWTNLVQYLSCCVDPGFVQIEQDSNGDIVVVGDFSGRISFSGHEMIASKFRGTFIVKLDSQGQYLWFRQIDSDGGVLDEAGSRAFAFDPSGNIYLTGYFTNSATIGPRQLSIKNVDDDRTGFLTRISPSGGFEWAIALYGRDVIPAGIEYSHSLDEIYLVGGAAQYLEYDNQYTSTAPWSHSFVATVGRDASLKQFRVINNESYPSYIHHIAISSQNDLYVAGNFHDDFTAGCVDFVGDGWYTDFLLKLGTSGSLLSESVTGSLCVGDEASIKLDGVVGPTKFTWSFSEGIMPLDGLYETTIPAITVVLSNIRSDAWAKVRFSFDCGDVVESRGDFSVSDVPAKPETPTGRELLCIGESSQYNISPASEDTKYEWQFSNNLSALPSETTIVTVSNLTKNATGTIRARAANDCGMSEWSEPLTILLHPSQQKPEVTGDPELCAGEMEIQFTSTAPGGAAVGWRVENGGVIRSALPDSISVFIDMPVGLSTISIRSTATGVCESAWSDVFIVNLIQPPPQITAIEGPLSTCRNSNEELVFKALPDQADVIYQWSFPDGFSVVQQTGNTLSLNTGAALNGAISVFVSNQCFNTSPARLNITVTAPPERPTIERLPCDRGLIYRGTDWYDWYFNGEPLLDEPRELMTLDSGVYRLTIGNECGLVSTDDFEVIPVIEGKVFIPNVVTDNDDGRNDKFIIDRSLQNASVLIVNRWGSEVFSSADYDNSWSGSGLPTGTYFYYIQHECLAKPLRGWVQVIR